MSKLADFFWGRSGKIPTDNEIIAWEKTRAKGFWRFALRSIAMVAVIYFLFFIWDWTHHKQLSLAYLLMQILEPIFIGVSIAAYAWHAQKTRCDGLAHTLAFNNPPHPPKTNQEQ